MATVAAAKGGEKPALRKPVFVKVDQLGPGTVGHTLTVKVVSAKPIAPRARAAGGGPAASRQVRIAECIVGDETGVIVFTARHDQGVSGFDLYSYCLVVVCEVYNAELFYVCEIYDA
jgi:replication factor A1